MLRFFNVFFFLCCPTFFVTTVVAQKKQLDHTVYDGWQSIGERTIAPDGNWLLYTIDVQEGDGVLVLQKVDSSVQHVFPRGYAASFTEDSRFVVFTIKPQYAETRAARIKKKKPEDFPSDSLGIYSIITGAYEKVACVVSYKLPAKAAGLLAYHLAKKPADTTKKVFNKDSSVLQRDTAKTKIPIILEQVPDKRQKRKMSATGEQDFGDGGSSMGHPTTASLAIDQSEAGYFPINPNGNNEWSLPIDADGDQMGSVQAPEGTNLVVRNLNQNKEFVLELVAEYMWSENGRLLLLESTASKKEKQIKPMVIIWRADEDRFDTLMVGANDIRNFTIDKDAYQIAFLAERDSSFTSLQRFHKVWYWRNGEKQARVLVDKFTPGMLLNWSISEHFTPYFSRSGNRLFVGTAPIKPIRDTSLVDVDLVKLDIWHYNDDHLQPYQLRTLEQEKKRSYLGCIDLKSTKFIQLADLELAQVMVSNEGDGDTFVGITDKGNRIAMQWNGATQKDIYAINPVTGARKLIVKGLEGLAQVSPLGKYIFWYDMKLKHYFVHLQDQNINISRSIAVKLYDEENDMPMLPSSYGVMRWHEGDEAVYVYDRFDIWKLDPAAKLPPVNITAGLGRKNKVSYRYLSTDAEERWVVHGQQLLLRSFDAVRKYAGFSRIKLAPGAVIEQLQSGAYGLGAPIKAKHVEAYVYTREHFSSSPNLYFSKDLVAVKRLSSINPQQSSYTWMTAELFNWKAYNGKTATGIVYKPENFQEGKKYPTIAYFYEKLSDGVYNYVAPSPTPSRLNIPFFVSRGYIVFVPDIHYQEGYPGKSAYDYVVSGARALVKRGWADSTKLGIQGQSWGGYQLAHIITRTSLFSAAWAGAPVANMTSAYGGIRWESGMNRQFQYEKSQSRIGATLWEKPQLYIENSPLFHLPMVKTPLVVMANDADGAVPWYQGIELFTAMRRLNQKVWMLNYNGEAHNLVERKNRKDIQIREQQFFDWLLKGEKPAVWLSKGVPATEKGSNWGLDIDLDQ